ncbi:MAG TPA: redox-sensing transcriptional repressor Rex [Gemmatimonadota bacterium]|nr:redox-sensing transcriptional repressor Rex [Gemmatimonadota bacterium]
MSPPRISDSAVRRLSQYLRYLDQVQAEGTGTVSSEDLARAGGMTPAQVRKDLSHFGSFGKRGLGYPVEELRARLTAILGLDREWRVCVVGAGRLGAALHQYDGFRRRGFEIVGIFDVDPAKIGRRWRDLVVENVTALDEAAEERGIEIGIVATPAEGAQDAVDRLARAGVRAILNFAPATIETPEGVAVRDVDLVVELESLSFALTHGRG